MPWVTNTNLIASSVAGILGIAPGVRPPPHWDTIIAAALAYSKSVVRQALAVRGFKPDQVEQWDDLDVFQRRVAICNAFREGGIGKGYDYVHLGEYCKAVGELATVPVTIGGVIVDPTADAGGCSSGAFAFSTALRVPGGFASDRVGGNDFGSGTDPDRFGRGGYW